MDVDLKTRWVEALRSGKYKQGVGYLRTIDEQFCCLGVLADINNEKWQKRKNEDCYFIVDSTDKMFPEKKGALGPKYDNFISTTARSRLILMNDMGGSGFLDIADWIEENVK